VHFVVGCTDSDTLARHDGSISEQRAAAARLLGLTTPLRELRMRIHRRTSRFQTGFLAKSQLVILTPFLAISWAVSIIGAAILQKSFGIIS
jgi:hypothetical protein